MFRIGTLLFAFFFAAGAAMAAEPDAASSPVDRPLVLQVRLEDEAISPGIERFLLRAVREAEQQEAEALVILLDTPGGLVDSTRRIVRAIHGSRTPVVIYVAPSGSRAASAGLFITLAADVAAMAPGTNIGAAHPVQLGGFPAGPRPGDAQPDAEGFSSILGGFPAVQASRGLAARGDGAVPTSRLAARATEQSPSGQQDANDEQDHKLADEKQRQEKTSKEKASDNRRPRADTPMQDKIVNDLVAWAQALVERRYYMDPEVEDAERLALKTKALEWVERAVRESHSLEASQAKAHGVVDLVAGSFDELLEQLDGRAVLLGEDRRKITLNTADAQVETITMWWGEQLLAVIARPNVAYLLMIFGFYGILFEFYSPGWGVSGTLGIICLLLAFFGLAFLPVNYLGLALIALGLGLLVAEVFVTSFGLLALAGTGCLVLGGLMLVETPFGFARVTLGVALPVAAATAVITLLLVSGIARTQWKPVQTGGEGLIGRTARAQVDFAPGQGQYAGRVFLHGENWRALSDKPIVSGQQCRVQQRQGLTLIVEPDDASKEIST